MSLVTLFAQHAAPYVEGPSPFRSQFLREQECNIPICGKRIHRVFIGV